ncbi:hypothetical protein FG386_000392 [Cryptosporidium ryanae]|uniref:uncharacterized protein n=1 Tax=Cryptosporidium ryanae TaxID=515981 RepID=UPI003519F653|nr:hypothetical protein FG386_000392 [Cryptosporidium ryanae]
MNDFLKDLLYFWKTSPTGTPTLTLLIFAFALYVIQRLLFFGSGRTIAPKKYVNKLYNVLIENIGSEIEEITKKFLNKRSKYISNNYTSDEIKELDNSVRKVIQTSSEITESLYNFLSAFHASYGDFPDSNEFTQYKTYIDSVPSSSEVGNYIQSVPNIMNGNGGKAPVCVFRDDDSNPNHKSGPIQTTTSNNLHVDNFHNSQIVNTDNKLEVMNLHTNYNPNSNIYPDLI